MGFKVWNGLHLALRYSRMFFFYQKRQWPPWFQSAKKQGPIRKTKQDFLIKREASKQNKVKQNKVKQNKAKQNKTGSTKLLPLYYQS